MQIQPLGDDKWRVFFRTDEFKQLVESAKHQRARTVMFLMAISLRVKTAANLSLGQFYQDDDGFWWMHIEAKDSTERDSETKPREVLVPEGVVDQIESHLGAKPGSLPNDKAVFDVEKRTLQRDIEDARENAAIATGNENYHKVSAHDFRRYYASHYLFRLNVDQHVTRQMGGWKRIEHMIEYLLLPRDLIKNRLSEAAVLGENPLTMTNSGPVDQVNANFDTIEYLAYQAESNEVDEALQDGLLELGQKVDGVSVVLDECKTESVNSDDSAQDELEQTSFKAHFGADEDGSMTPEMAAKATYVLSLISASWLITLGPIA